MTKVASDWAVELTGISKSFGNVRAVQPLDLQIPHGSIYGVIGPNGSGKTTTLRTILRIYRPDTGTVRVLGQENRDVADDRVGYLPEERGLYRRMTVRRILRYFAKLKGCRHPDANIDKWMIRLQAGDWYKKRIDQLSKGMAQKVQFVAAVASAPELVILDEPFSGLDPVNMEIIKNAILDLRREGTTVILSTHDMTIAQSMCDSVCMIFRGKKVLDGTIEEITKQTGAPRWRVRWRDTSIPIDKVAQIPGVLRAMASHQDSFEIETSPQLVQSDLLQSILSIGDIDLFEIAKPTLHDIFVRIASA